MADLVLLVGFGSPSDQILANISIQAHWTSISKIRILELTFHIRQNEIVENIRQKNLWEELSERQKLALWFFHEDCSVDDSAKYLEISKGHLYNMRSELRRHFKLKDEDPITHIWSSPVNF